MARLAAQEKMLFYPTWTKSLEMIKDRLTFQESQSGDKPTMLDPSAGDGRAIEILGGSDAETYAIELDAGRASKIKADYVLTGPRELGQFSGPFDLIFDNPPYDHGLGAGRQEISHFKLDMALLSDAGLFIGLWPMSTLKGNVSLLNQFLNDIYLYKMPDPEFEKFQQVFIFGKKKRGYSYGNYGQFARIDSMVKTGQIPTLGDWHANAQWKIWRGYRSINPHSFVLKNTDLVELQDMALMQGVTTDPIYQQLLGHNVKDIGRISPLLKMRPGHVGLAIAAGAVNGTETIIDGMPVLIKGSSRKVIKTSQDVTSYPEDEESDSPAYDETVITEDEIPAHTVTTLCLKTGQVELYETTDDEEGQSRFASFLETHKDSLSAATHDACPPQVNPDDERYDKFREVLANRVHAPGRLPGTNIEGILPVQVERIIAMAQYILSGEKAVMLSGEMGCGKTVMSLAALALIAHFQGLENWKHVIVAPANVCYKWQRESEKVLSDFGVKAHVIGHEIKRPDGKGKIRKCSKPVLDVDAAMAEQNPSILIMSYETAKNAAKWQHAPGKTIKRISMRVDSGSMAEQYQDKYLTVLACPSCGYPWLDEDGLYTSNVKKMGVGSKKRKHACSKCGGALWTQEGFSYGGRVAIADYLNRHYAGQFSLTIDEAHNTKGHDTDIGYASADLISAARWTIAMTGTMHNGYTSSIFNISYRLFEAMRILYQYGEQSRFVARHGLLRSVTKVRKYKTYHSSYGYERVMNSSPQEIPGVTPNLVAWLLERTVFIHLADVSDNLPEYTEYKLPIYPDDVIQGGLDKMADLKDDAGKLARKGKMSLLSNWLSAAIGWPDKPVTEEIVYTGEDDELHIWVLDGYESLPITPKVETLYNLIENEVEQGRGVGIFFSQVNRRDWMESLRDLLAKHDYYAEIFRRNMASPSKREEWYREFLRRSKIYAPSQAPILLTNGNLFKEGLDLLELPTIVEAGIDFNLTNVRQRDRRSWRLTQDRPVKVVFMYYEGSHQEVALSLMARKFKASKQYEGESISGLAAMADSDLYDSFMNLMIKGEMDATIEMPTYNFETEQEDFYMLPKLKKEVVLNGSAAMSQQLTLLQRSESNG